MGDIVQNGNLLEVSYDIRIKIFNCINRSMKI